MTRIDPQPVSSGQLDPSRETGGDARTLVTGISESLAPLRRWRIWQKLARLSRLGLPLSVSIVFHIAVALLLLVSAWNFRTGVAGGRARTELVISLPVAAPAPAPAREPSAAQMAPPAPISAAPPVLQGL